jgi:prophage maintenance system killer protein
MEKQQEKEISELLSGYSKALELLRQYDDDDLRMLQNARPKFKLDYETAKSVVSEIKKELAPEGEKNSELFGREYENKLAAIIGNIYQIFNGEELYFSLEEKAGHLLYFLVKDHPFMDGNKRIAAFIFVYFLSKNDYLYGEKAEKKIDNNALASLTLLIAVSRPEEKEKMVKIIANFIS